MGKNADGTKAADMETGDFSKKQITDINWLFNIQINEDSDTLYDEFSGMSTDLFTTGEMEKVVLAMINHIFTEPGMVLGIFHEQAEKAMAGFREFMEQENADNAWRMR